VEEFIDSRKLKLSEFLDKLLSKDYSRLYPNNHFPTEEMMNEYLAAVSDRTDDQIRSLLRRFLIHNCTFGLDDFNADVLIRKIKDKTYIASSGIKTEYNRRLLQHTLTKKGEVWEGLTWVLDLLPHFPNEAIQAIDAYFLANCQMLPDTWLNALSDSTTIIRARYINYEHPKEIFWNLHPTDFEYLVATLYENMGYDVSLTKASYDNGIDVNATKNELGKKEKLVIQCKRYTKQTIGVADIRNLLGVVSDKKVTKGILVTTTKFSFEAKRFEKNNPSIELIDCFDLMKLLNTHLGTYWVSKINSIINELKIKNNHH
jgi:restriction system protein